MTDLLWPGDDRAGDVFTDAAVLAAMVRAEAAWLTALVAHGVAEPAAADDLDGLIGPDDVPLVAAGSEAGGNPLIPLLTLLRERLKARNPAAASWLHKGLTSQDVIDTGLVLCLRDAAGQIQSQIKVQTDLLVRLAEEHRDTLMPGRTLTQYAVPISFGLKAVTWLNGILDARDRLALAAALPVQIGGAAGSLAAPVALTGSPITVRGLIETAADTLGLPVRDPWHTARAPLTGIADALVTCTDAWGRLANDVLVGARPEVHELSEGAVAGRGGSSAMPNKQNPVLSILIRRAALAGPMLAATMHTAAAAAVDERPDGGWHIEWATLRTLARRTVTAGSQTAELLSGLQVEKAWMTANLASARPGIDAEQRSITSGTADDRYLGATTEIIDAAVARARAPHP
ncbi:lyase family protein [Actinoplanes couchii]|uniref:3-carboxy-cis,cis-muconate cycloisomerase n=1 Tax=Actinoplanes couchii TaxID=403638 RepID=A0ABQ3XM86_9ACTN|nr:lyase family protein [Actinoplanes couchii]MDR6321520.1 3-carboxy-cis,cis-muconate cycloisomerase [Actinoplanes couchii]GID59616.1 3-carboxy-cis,cis-muconate cycloisomerase [Actinoplanes couchii]